MLYVTKCVSIADLYIYIMFCWRLLDECVYDYNHDVVENCSYNDDKYDDEHGNG